MGKSSFQWHLGQLKDQHRQQQQDTKQYRHKKMQKGIKYYRLMPFVTI